MMETKLGYPMNETEALEGITRTTHLQARSERVQMLRELAHQINGTLTNAADRVYGPEPKDSAKTEPDYADAGGFAQLDLCLNELEVVMRQCVAEAARFSDI